MPTIQDIVVAMLLAKSVIAPTKPNVD